MVGAARQNRGKDAHTPFLIVEAASVKNPDTADAKGYDAGKKGSGIKRQLGVDRPGLPPGIHIPPAQVSDKAGALAAVQRHKPHLPKVQHVLVDGGYTGKPLAQAVDDMRGAPVEGAKGNELPPFTVIPNRGVVERSFAGLEKCRRLWKHCERQLTSSRHMTVLAFLALLLKSSETGSKGGW